ncbi:hypothetical protein Q7P37_001726 [Cladosporium fusiforme]
MTEWQNGLCSGVCGGDCGTCWGSWCCTPCLYGRASQRLDIYPTNDTEQIDTCDTNCWLFCLTGTMFLHWVPMMLKRTAMREHFNIEGDVCRDGMVSLCCTPCGVAQMNTEMKDRAEKAHLMPQHGYVQPQGMAYQQPYPQQPYQQQY